MCNDLESIIFNIKHRSEYIGKNIENGASIIEALASHVNKGRDEHIAEGMYYAFRSTHRYLQSMIVDTIIHFLATVDARYTKNNTDSRNEDAIKRIHRMVMCGTLGGPDFSVSDERYMRVEPRKWIDGCEECCSSEGCEKCQYKGWVETDRVM